MELVDSPAVFSSELDVDAVKRLFPFRFYEHHLAESIRPDGRSIGGVRDTCVSLGAVVASDGSALVKIGSTTMLAAIKMEVMTPLSESPDEGSIAIEFHMPPICSPLVRPGRPADAAPVVLKQLNDTILKSRMIELKELSLVSGKAAWMANLDIYCLDADGSLFDAALLAAVAAFSHLQIPEVSQNDDGRIVVISKDKKRTNKESVNKEKRKLNLTNVPFSLTCVLHKGYILPNPTADEESITETLVTDALDASDQLVSLYKPGGQSMSYSSVLKDCVRLAKKRAVELKDILAAATSDMDID